MEGKEGCYADQETRAIPDLSAGQRGELRATGWEISGERGSPPPPPLLAATIPLGLSLLAKGLFLPGEGRGLPERGGTGGVPRLVQIVPLP